jgi:hypothetical protein
MIMESNRRKKRLSASNCASREEEEEEGILAYHLDEEVADVGQREVVDVFIIVAVQVG